MNAMTSNEKLDDECAVHEPPALLQGVETLDLYLGAVRCNVKALDEQIALLRAVLAERQELLRLAVLSCADNGRAEPRGRL
jgi:hypothetical protein